MGTRRLSMRQLREILRLKHEQKLSHRAIARACRVGVGTVSEYVRRAARAGLEWPLPEELDEAALEARLFSSARTGLPGTGGSRCRADPPGVEACWSHPPPALGRVPGSESKGICLQPVLCDLRAVGPETEALDAAGAPRRREDLHRLFRQTARTDGSADGHN